MTSTRVILLVIAWWLAGTYPSAEQGIQCDAPLSEAALKDLVAAGVPVARLRQFISNCGLDLREGDAAATEARLRTIGVPAAAMSALAPPASPTAGARWTSPFDRRPMAFVPAGSFRMGSPSDEAKRDADETPHEIKAGGFWMDTEEVTNEAFQRFVLSRVEWQKGSVRPEFQNGTYLKDWDGTRFPAGKGDAPVVWVSWHAARAYAAWAGKRLPTEAEWEYAARGGTSTRYWWGNDFDARRVAVDDKPAPADQLQLRINPWGLRDMVGGVWEWTSSVYMAYPYMADGREDARAAAARSIRGGSRANGDAFVRSANRSMEEAAAANDLLGFRCVR